MRHRESRSLDPHEQVLFGTVGGLPVIGQKAAGVAGIRREGPIREVNGRVLRKVADQGALPDTFLRTGQGGGRSCAGAHGLGLVGQRHVASAELPKEEGSSIALREIGPVSPPYT